MSEINRCIDCDHVIGIEEYSDGHRIIMYQSDLSRMDDVDLSVAYKYCPNCGAEIVKE